MRRRSAEAERKGVVRGRTGTPGRSPLRDALGGRRGSSGRAAQPRSGVLGGVPYRFIRKALSEQESHGNGSPQPSPQQGEGCRAPSSRHGARQAETRPAEARSASPSPTMHAGIRRFWKGRGPLTYQRADSWSMFTVAGDSAEPGDARSADSEDAEPDIRLVSVCLRIARGTPPVRGKKHLRALSSAWLEHLPYKQEVGGSSPSAPTGSLGCSGLEYGPLRGHSRPRATCLPGRAPSSVSRMNGADLITRLTAVLEGRYRIERELG